MSNMRTIRVTGKGQIKVKPDTIVAYFTRKNKQGTGTHCTINGMIYLLPLRCEIPRGIMRKNCGGRFHEHHGEPGGTVL